MSGISTLQRMALLGKLPHNDQASVVVEPSQRPVIKGLPAFQGFPRPKPSEIITTPPPAEDPAHTLQRELTTYGNSVRQESFTILASAGGVTWPQLVRSGVSSVIRKEAWLIGIQMSAGFSMNSVNNFDVAAGIDIGPTVNLSGAANLFLIFSHALGAVPAASVTVSKGGALFFQYPFLPRIGAGNRLCGYVKADLGVDENIYASVTFYYVSPI